MQRQFDILGLVPEATTAKLKYVEIAGLKCTLHATMMNEVNFVEKYLEKTSISIHFFSRNINA